MDMLLMASARVTSNRPREAGARLLRPALGLLVLFLVVLALQAPVLAVTAAQPNRFCATTDEPWSSVVALDGETVLVGDFDGDGKDDLLCLRIEGDTVIPLVCRSTGSAFEPPREWTGGRSAYTSHIAACLAGDFNGDGKDDLGVLTRVGDVAAVVVTLSGGTDFGGWAEWLNSDLLSRGKVLLGDVNRDGRDDLVCFAMDERDGEGAGDVYVATAAHDRESDRRFFSTPAKWHEDFGRGSMKPLVGDVDGDDRADIIVCAGGNAYPAQGLAAGAVLVARSDGERSFVSEAQPWRTQVALHDEYIEAGDVSGDRLADLVIFTRGEPATHRPIDPQGDVYTFLSDGSSFGPSVRRNDSFCYGEDVPLLGDFNGDRYQGINVPRPSHDDIVAVSGNRGRTADRGLARVVISTFGRSTTWKIRFDQLRVNVKNELTADEPYLLSLGFQGTFGSDRSCTVSYRGYHDGWSGGMDTGDVRDIPEVQGVIYFPGVILQTRRSLRHSAPQVMGALVVMMEGDFTPSSDTDRIIEEGKRKLLDTLHNEVERRRAEEFSPQVVIDALEELKTDIALHRGVSELIDNDDYIGYHVFLLLAVDPECSDLLERWPRSPASEGSAACFTMESLWPKGFVFDRNPLTFTTTLATQGEYVVSGVIESGR